MILLDMACLIDPRFKLQYTQEENREHIKERAVLDMRRERELLWQEKMSPEKKPLEMPL